MQLKVAEDGAIDYKKTVCGYFKAGVCEKGKKCKYSHDLSLDEARQANIDIYADPRAKIGKMPDTIITCKDFVAAVEKSQYGFNWVCPNGGEACPYRHMLPAGYVLKKDKGKKGQDGDDSEDELTVEEKIEKKRAALPASGLTPVTLASFTAWKERKAKAKQEELEARIVAEQAKGKKNTAQMAFMSGRALFTYNPDLFEDAEGAIDEAQYDENYSGDDDSENEEKKVATNGEPNSDQDDDMDDDEEKKVD